jgi:hypothetical protein
MVRRDTLTRSNNSPMVMNGSAIRSATAGAVVFAAADSYRSRSLITSEIVAARAATASSNSLSCGLCLISANT